MGGLSLHTCLALIAWAVWSVFCGYIVGSPLDNIPGPKRAPLWKGNAHQLYARHAWDFHHHLSENYGQVVKFYAPLGGRGLYVFDPKALHHVVVKDLAIFEEPRWFLHFGPGLFSTSGEHHRRQRKVLNPVFSVNHIRNMTPIFYDVARRLRRGLTAEISSAGPEVEILDWLSRTALELIGQGGLGHSLDTLESRKQNTYRDALKQLLPTHMALHFWRILLPYAVKYVPLSIRRAIGPRLPHPTMQKLRRIIDTMDGQARAIYYAKKGALERGDKSGEHQINDGRDMLSVLMNANRDAPESERLDDEEVIAQISTLVFASTDTTSSTMARLVDLLARNQAVQDKLRAELLDAGPDGEDIPYDRLSELPYLDAICRETLRLYPTVTFMSREARQDTVLPPSTPIEGLDGSLVTQIAIPKDTPIIVGIRACNRNRAVWGEDALEWKPDRWLSSLPGSVSEARVPGIYSHLMSFIGGGRACVGFKFAQLEIKVLLATLLRAFRISPGTREVYWNLASVSYPTLGRDGDKAVTYVQLERIEA
ncbi:cytochrome P450 [Phanerochaete sordida]|uniref:Cytochrome P450 n=1 Tax=Phanerochaete sordida TaxID=48140 RepID=A0A9P3L7T5_9APHY|nr:cytochrome P450 [Phanerochaete sordida]